MRLYPARVAQIQRLISQDVKYVYVAGDGGPRAPHIPVFIALTPFVLVFVMYRVVMELLNRSPYGKTYYLAVSDEYMYVIPVKGNYATPDVGKSRSIPRINMRVLVYRRRSELTVGGQRLHLSKEDGLDICQIFGVEPADVTQSED